MEDLFSQLSIGGIFAILTIREVLNFLKTYKEKKENGGSGARSVEFWREQISQITKESMESILAKELREIRNDTTKIREYQQDANGLLQQIANELHYNKERRQR